MKISRAEVEHVAHLARLGLTDDELEKLREQLSSILENMEVLGELDTAAIPPTAHVLPVENVMRPDVVGQCLPVEDVLLNAPRAEEGFFHIPPVFEEDYEK
ncbi:MAG: Asp-tRNA(Asn)/Glu-tRNA(Gln) amidotransferase subunit GatC [Chloroflexi bacterium]|nr:Asp-tRNA(Asn)/Glu-tRNA(Gln) amidotransferase subunit GatC [Chloroflexota bacterium]